MKVRTMFLSVALLFTAGVALGADAIVMALVGCVTLSALFEGLVSVTGPDSVR